MPVNGKRLHLAVQLEVGEGLGHHVLRGAGELSELGRVRCEALPCLSCVLAGSRQCGLDALVVRQLAQLVVDIAPGEELGRQPAGRSDGVYIATSNGDDRGRVPCALSADTIFTS